MSTRKSIFRAFSVWIVVTLMLMALSPSLAAALSDLDITPPAQPVKLIFIHHSTGENWLTDGYGNLGATLNANNYFVSDTNYSWGPTWTGNGPIGDYTDIPNWTEWFRSASTPTYMSALFNESGQHSSYTRTVVNPGGENEIIMFKSCFPNSALEGSPSDPPSASGELTVGHAKYVYNQILQYFGAHPEKLFIVITAPPLQDDTYAANARAFNEWLMNDWLTENGYTLSNVAVFDFYNVLTGDANHHRYFGGAIEHVFTAGANTLHYPSGDDHPSITGSRKATTEFVPLLNIFYHRWYNALWPRVTSIVRSDPNMTEADSVNFTVTFSKPVTGVNIDDPSDFSLFTDGLTGASITAISGSGTTYQVTASTGSGRGIMRLDVVDDDTILDADLHPLGGTGAGNGNFTSGQTYAVRQLAQTFSSNGAQDGWILESGEKTSKGGTTKNSTYTTIRLGDSATKKQYRGILSFKTSTLDANAAITGITLKVRKQGITGGGNPVTTFKGFMVDMKRGFIGTSPSLQAADFQTTASKTYGPFKTVISGVWYNIDLTSGQTYINKLSTSYYGLTQIRLRFYLDDNNNTTANYLSLYSGNAGVTSRPQLVIQYYVP